MISLLLVGLPLVAAITPFPCSNNQFQVSAPPSSLFTMTRIDTSGVALEITTVYEFDAASGNGDSITNGNGAINGAGLNIADNFAYATGKVDGSSDRLSLIKLGIDGWLNLGQITCGQAGGCTVDGGTVSFGGLYPNAGRSTLYVGDMDTSGILYATVKSVSWYIKIDVATLQYTVGSGTAITGADFAFNPLDNLFYAVQDSNVDADSLLCSWDLKGTGTRSCLTLTGLPILNSDPVEYHKMTGTQGGASFDGAGNMYAFLNSDVIAGGSGKSALFKVDTSSLTLTRLADGAEAVSANDAFSCVDPSNVDWGDAPDSYLTSFANNGPRHLIYQDSLFLGNLIDGELGVSQLDGYGDDVIGDDEDGFTDHVVGGHLEYESGLTFFDLFFKVTNIFNKNVAIAAWYDWDGDGSFLESGDLCAVRQIEPGSYPRISLTCSSTTKVTTIGSSFVRIRLSSNYNDVVNPFGPAVDGEVEDWEVVIVSPAPTPSPTLGPTDTPTTATPTVAPTRYPTAPPPTSYPTPSPTAVPSDAPSAQPTNVPTLAPTTAAPTTLAPTTAPGTTVAPTTSSPTSPPSTAPSSPPTPAPSLAPGTTASPTTLAPSLAPGTTAAPTQPRGTVSPAPTSSPTTLAPTLAPGTTASPTTLAPTLAPGTTASPTTLAPTLAPGTTASPTTLAPTLAPGTTASPTTLAPTLAPGTTASPTTLAPDTTASPTTLAPTLAPGTTASPTTAAPSLAPGTASPTTAAPSLAPGTTAVPSLAPGTTASPTAARTATASSATWVRPAFGLVALAALMVI